MLEPTSATAICLSLLNDQVKLEFLNEWAG